MYFITRDPARRGLGSRARPGRARSVDGSSRLQPKRAATCERPARPSRPTQIGARLSANTSSAASIRLPRAPQRVPVARRTRPRDSRSRRRARSARRSCARATRPVQQRCAGSYSGSRWMPVPTRSRVVAPSTARGGHERRRAPAVGRRSGARATHSEWKPSASATARRRAARRRAARSRPESRRARASTTGRGRRPSLGRAVLPAAVDRLVRARDLDQRPVRALRHHPRPALPRHVGSWFSSGSVVRPSSASRRATAPGSSVVKQMWCTCSPRFSSRRPSGVSGRGLHQLDLGAVVGDERRPAHLVVAALEVLVADDLLLQLARVERAQDLGPVGDRLVEVLDQQAHVGEGSGRHLGSLLSRGKDQRRGAVDGARAAGDVEPHRADGAPVLDRLDAAGGDDRVPGEDVGQQAHLEARRRARRGRPRAACRAPSARLAGPWLTAAARVGRVEVDRVGVVEHDRERLHALGADRLDHERPERSWRRRRGRMKVFVVAARPRRRRARPARSRNVSTSKRPGLAAVLALDSRRPRR